MIKNRIRLIPRYNWDYGIRDFLYSFLSIFNQNIKESDFWRNTFKHEPLFTNSGRTSLYIILKSLGLPENSYIGVPLFCCSVVVDTISQAGFKPIFIDIDLENYNLSVNDLRRKISSLSSLVVVHMFGYPADIDSILSETNNIPVIEDCAQSLFSQYKKTYTGNCSLASFFSFRSGKYISAGEGSVLFTSEPLLYKRMQDYIKKLDQFNKIKQTVHCASTLLKSILYKRPLYGTFSFPVGKLLDRKLNLTAKSGFNFKKIASCDLSTINKRIKTISKSIEKQKRNSLYLLNNLKLQNATLLREKKDYSCNYYQFPIRFESERKRDYIAQYLFAHGIDSAKYLSDIIDYVNKAYGYNGDCPNTELCTKTLLSIPHYYSLSKRDLDHIVKCLNNANKNFIQSSGN